MTIAGSIAALIARWTSLDPTVADLLARLIAIALTAAVLWIAYVVVTGVVNRLVARHAAQPGAPHGARLRTVASLLSSLARWFIAFVSLVIVLRELGVDVQALIVSAGIVGVALAFGAQSLVRDVITGFFLLVEGLVAVGDTVQVGSYAGTIESMGLRVTTVRLTDGALHVLPNGQLTEFTNLNAGWARAVVDIGVPREAPVERALDVLRRVGEEWARETGRALEQPQAQGIIKFSGGDPVLRLMVRVDPALRFDTEAELRRRIKAAFDREQWSVAGAA
ncbi:MAG TPA: mechanosensitive ion channel family protein [Methylomirabilota bacterium]